MLDSKEAEDMLIQMLRIRQFEETCAEQYGEERIRGFLHLYIGQEAIAVGTLRNLTTLDSVFATYREHGHALIRGIPARTIMAEMFGKLEGCCRGRGGSMHIFDKDRRFFGGSAIVGGSLPVAVGMALAEKMQRANNISVCFFGEGAMAEGAFHEAMNLAALWSLPILFVCENNLYAMGTALQRSESEPDLAKKAAAYRVTSSSVDGMDVLAVHESVKKAVRDIRELGTPYFLECKTYRFRAHSMFDAELYRDKEEVEHWKARDPIRLLTDSLKQNQMLDGAKLEELKQAVANELADAVEFATNGSIEPVSELHRYVYANSVQE